MTDPTDHDAGCPCQGRMTVAEAEALLAVERAARTVGDKADVLAGVEGVPIGKPQIANARFEVAQAVANMDAALHRLDAIRRSSGG